MGDVSQRRRTWAAALLSEHLLVIGGKGADPALCWCWQQSLASSSPHLAEEICRALSFWEASQEGPQVLQLLLGAVSGVTALVLVEGGCSLHRQLCFLGGVTLLSLPASVRRLPYQGLGTCCVFVLQRCVQSLSINRQTAASPREWGLEGLSGMFLSWGVIPGLSLSLWLSSKLWRPVHSPWQVSCSWGQGHRSASSLLGDSAARFLLHAPQCIC